jgi:Uma2 family endonuclease
VTIAVEPVKKSHLAEPTERLWTREDWDRLVEMGFFEGERLELIEGRIICMSPQHVPHSAAIEIVDIYVRRAFAKGYRIRSQLPFRTADGSEPEPDFAIVPGDNPRAARQHPSSAVLIVEISDTTLRHDRNKAKLYAVSKVPEYWIINLVARNMEVYREPRTRNRVAAYQNLRTLKEQEEITPLHSTLPVKIADLLP